jgi:putative transposase
MTAHKEEVATVSAEQRAAVARLLGQERLNRRLRERLEMVKARALGQDVEQIARWCGRTGETVRHWLRRYQAAGVAGLRDAPRSGRPRRADAAYRAALEQAVSSPPRELGLGFDAWTSARLARYLAEQTGVQLSDGWVRALLGELDFVCGRPKHTLQHLQDAEEVAACEAELAAAHKSRQRGPGALRIAS